MPSEAHVFPNAMGGATASKNTVCVECNSQSNNEAEMTTINSFAFFQSIWGIKGRRDQKKCVPAIVRFNDKEAITYLNEYGEPVNEIVFTELNEAGKKRYSIIGPADKIAKRQQQIDRKHADIKWKELKLEQLRSIQLMVPFDHDLARLALRRTAAKVAFERWAQLRGSLFVQHKEYNTVRDFILTSSENRPCCGVLADTQLLNGLLNFSLPHHAVLIIAHPKNSVLGAFVAFYGLFYFWVILSNEYISLRAFDDLLMENPQTGSVENPVFRMQIGSLSVHWNQLVNEYSADPQGVIQRAILHAKQKFHTAADAFYDSINSISESNLG